MRHIHLACSFIILATTLLRAQTTTNSLSSSTLVSPYDQTISAGNVALKAGNFSEAHQAAMKALSLEGNRFEAYALESLALFKQGKTEQAKAFMDIALAKASPNKKSQLEALAAAIEGRNAGDLPSMSPSGTVTTRPSSVSSEADHLTGNDRLEYETLLSLLSDADKSTDLGERNRILRNFMGRSSNFLKSHPNMVRLWVARAAVAVELNQVQDGWEAGQRLTALRLKDSTDPAIEQVMVQLNEKGWLTETPPENGWATGGSSESNELNENDRIQYKTLLSMLDNAEKATDSDDRRRILSDFMDKSHDFSMSHSDLVYLWAGRAAAAMDLGVIPEVYNAAQYLTAVDQTNCDDLKIRDTTLKLNENGWLNSGVNTPSSIRFGEPHLNRKILKLNDTITISFTVKNETASDANVLLKIFSSKLHRKDLSLVDFAYIHLDSDQSAHVNRSIPVERLGEWDSDQRRYVADSGKYQLFIGAAADDIRLRLPLVITSE